MKKRTMICTLFCVLVMTMLGGISVSAAGTPKCEKTHTVYYTKNPSGDLIMNDTITSYIYIKNLASDAKITNLKSLSSDVEVSKVKGLNAVYVSPVTGIDGTNSLPDSVKISFKVKQGGETYKLSCTVNFKKRPASTIKQVTFGKKDYTSKLQKYSDVYAAVNGIKKPSASKAKFTVKLGTKYKLLSIVAYYNDGTSKNVSNGSKISTKNLNSISVVYKVKTKPTYYKKPTSSYVGGKLASPLYEMFTIGF